MLGFTSALAKIISLTPIIASEQGCPVSTSDAEWMRLPKPKERCPVTGLSRTSLVEILDEKNPATQEPYVLQMRKERHGKQRKIRLIHKQSLLDYFTACAKRQNALKFAAHVSNPQEHTVEEVITDQDLFHQFLGPDNPLTDADWNDGKLSTRPARIKALRDFGMLQ